MLGTVILKEVLRHLLSLRFAVTFLLILFLGLVSVVLSVNTYERGREEYLARTRGYEHALTEIMGREKYWDKWQGLFWREGKGEAVPPGPLSPLVQGLTPISPAAVNVTAGWSASVDRSASRNPLMGLYHTPDLVYILSVVVSLLAILFVFDGISGEKEDGTLRLTLSNAIPRHTILLGKWIGGFITLAAPLSTTSAVTVTGSRIPCEMRM